MKSIARRFLAGLATGVAAAGLAPAASASISPTVTLTQTAGTAAASTVPLGMDLKFHPSTGDSPKDLTLSLPPGLLADASIDGGICLRRSTPVPACKVGSGTVTASTRAPIPVPLPPIGVAFYLVAPPKRGDLAGLAVVITLTGSQLGSHGEITVRPSGDPAGVGLNITLTNIPETYLLARISVDELQSTFNALRLPASCPAIPANVTVTADSYKAATVRSTSAPLHVTGCSGLAYTPAFHVTAVKDTADSGVQVTTDLTQPVTPVQATSRTVALTLPGAVLSPNVAAVVNGGILCPDPSSGTCKTIGTASSTSRLYPTALTGKAYLTGSLSAPAIALVFPPPFVLTLDGNIDLANNTTTFDNVPDIPLTDLRVTLTGGPDSVFVASCSPASGTATSTVTTQNNDRTVMVSAPFTVSGCSAPAGGGGTTPIGQPTGSAHKPGRPRLRDASVSGLVHGRPALKFRLFAGTNAPQLASFRVKLPRGLRVVKRRVHKRLTITGISVKGAKVKSIVLRRGRLVVVLRRPVSSLSVKIHASALAESRGLRHRARRHRVKRLKLTVLIKDAAGTRTTVSQRMKNLRR